MALSDRVRGLEEAVKGITAQIRALPMQPERRAAIEGIIQRLADVPKHMICLELIGLLPQRGLGTLAEEKLRSCLEEVRGEWTPINKSV